VNGVEANRPVMCRVVAVGEGYYDDDKDVPLDSKVGDVVLVGQLSVNWFSVFGPIVCDAKTQLGITREAEIKMMVRGEENYKKMGTILRDAVYATD